MRGKWMSWGVILLTLSVAAPHCWAQVQAVTTAKVDLELGFTVPGKVETVLVKPGDVVKAGQVLVTLEDKEGQAIIDRLRLRLANDAEVRANKAKHKLSQLQEDRLRELVAKDAAAPFELKSAEVQTEIAGLEVEIAQQGMDELQKQLEQAEARHDQFSLRAPEAGSIEVIKIEVGELVDEQKPILRLVMTDVLRIDAPVPTEQTLKLEAGGSAWVRSSLPGYDEPVEGKIVFVAKVADAASDTRLVRVEVPNVRSLPAGGHVTVEFRDPRAQVSQVSP